MAMEVFTTKDKAKRDQMFQELRSSDQPLERKVVKFSGVEAVANDKGQLYRKVQYNGGRLQMRPIFISTWSLAYPTN
jgi:hypothetical protein